uniref:Uncharacterized protein n=1 Tax=viral metagenome TaxID=1070528 RepID=A0A6C0HSE4_9ZZZZ
MEIKGYKNIIEIDKLRYGSYIRWIYKNDINCTLQKGILVCDIIIGDEGINIKGKTFNNHFITIKIDDCIIFQKLSKQELIIHKIKNTI